MYLHITFTDGSNPYIKFYYNENPMRSVAKDIRSWKRHYVVMDRYTTEDGDVELTLRHKTYAEEEDMQKAARKYYNRMKRSSYPRRSLEGMEKIFGQILCRRQVTAWSC